MSFVLTLALSSSFSSSKSLDETSDKLVSAIGFLGDEAILKNSVIRIHFDLSKQPQEYAVEYGPNDSFIQPPLAEQESNRMLSLEEQEKQDKKDKELNLQFNKVQEFQEGNTEIPEDVRMIGVGSAVSKKLQSTGKISVYAYPSGEKDDSILIFGNEDTIVSLRISPFSNEIDKKTQALNKVENRDVSDLQDEAAQSIFEEWLREK